MSVNTSEEYLDELLQAIEPIIGKDETQELPVSEPQTIPVSEPQEEISLSDLMPELMSDTVEEISIQEPEEEPIFSEMTEKVEDSVDVDELLAALSAEAAKETEGEPDQASTPEDDQDVMSLLEQFANEDGYADIQEIPDITQIDDRERENPELENIELLKEPELESIELQKEPVEIEKDTDEKKGGLLGRFKKKKSKKAAKASKEAEQVIGEKESVTQESKQPQDFEILPETSDFMSSDLMSSDLVSDLVGGDVLVESESTGLEEMHLEDLLVEGDSIDIDALLSSGSFEADHAAGDGSQGDTSLKNGKKESFFSKIFALLTEEDEEEEKADKSKKSSVPEASETGITDENETILEELSKEEKKKRKKEEKERKKKEKEEKKKGKGADASGEEDEEKSDKENDAKKKKKEKKAKIRKTEVIDEKPAKKISKKKIFIVFAFCFTIMAMILILQTVLLDVSNIKGARWAFDNADYETCYANLYGVDRNEEEEIMFQRSYIILCLQRKWDSYQNLKQMDMEIEALDTLFEGIRLYRDDMEVKAESYDIVNRVLPIYDKIYDELMTYGLTDADIEEILAYKSKVSYTKRLESIVNGTTFVENGWLTKTDDSDAEEETEITVKSLNDVLPMEEDFLPE